MMQQHMSGKQNCNLYSAGLTAVKASGPPQMRVASPAQAIEHWEEVSAEYRERVCLAGRHL